FFGETLGCRLEEIENLASAGFDYLFNSSKWWDFQDEWCLEQYESNRHIAPSVSFPESHDTERLAAEVNGNMDVVKRSYAFAAAFSAGIMMPVGYEYGFRKRLHVVRTDPSDWEEPGFDISELVRAANNMKACCPILNEEAPIRRMPDQTDSVTVLLKCSERNSGKACIIINRDVEQSRLINLPAFFDSVGTAEDQIEDISPENRISLPGRSECLLGPAEVKVFHILHRD
ncbi:MAG: alpha-amylase, partial [Pseudomonadota bacterium]